MRSPFSTKEQINLWAKRYTDGQTGAQRVVEKYLMGLNKNRSGTQDTQDIQRLFTL